MAGLKVGAARVSINPPDEMYPFPSPFGVCDEKRDECFVRAVAIDNGEKRILFVVYELGGVPRLPGLAGTISQACGVAEENIILTAIHNHTAPGDSGKTNDMPEKREAYKEIEINASIEVSRKAVDSLRPARYGYGEIDSYCNVNRDLKTRFGFWVEGPCYEGYSNKTLAVLKFVDMEGKLIAALLNYGAHAVCAFVQKDADGKVKSSSNFPGIACRFVEEYYGGDAVAVWTSGAAGNQDPILFDYVWQEFPDGYVTKLPLPDGTGYIHIDVLGGKQGADAVTCLEAINDLSGEMQIAYLKSIVPVQARKRDPNFVMPPFGLRMGGEGPRTDFTPPKMPELPVLVPDTERNINFELDVLRLGNVAVVLASGELYAEIARDMMAAAPVDNIFVITHIPGEGGYTLDKGSKDHKTFQSFGGVEPGAADEPLIERTKELVTKAFEI